MLSALGGWAAREREKRPELLQLGYFGSYARGDAGVGSDLDLVAIVRESSRPFERRAADWPVEELPVPAELLVYTEAEWAALGAQGGRFARTLALEVEWID